jgi:hypothetical protein
MEDKHPDQPRKTWAVVRYSVPPGEAGRVAYFGPSFEDAYELARWLATRGVEASVIRVGAVPETEPVL